MNGLHLPNLQARLGKPAAGGPVGNPTETTGEIHNKLVLVNAGGRGVLRGTMHGADRRLSVSVAQEMLLRVIAP